MEKQVGISYRRKRAHEKYLPRRAPFPEPRRGLLAFGNNTAERAAVFRSQARSLSELMTHPDIKITLRYAHLAPEKKKEAVEMIL